MARHCQLTQTTKRPDDPAAILTLDQDVVPDAAAAPAGAVELADRGGGSGTSPAPADQDGAGCDD